VFDGTIPDSAQEKTMKVTRTDMGDETVVAIEGFLDAQTAHELEPVAVGLVNDGRKSVTLDCSGLDKLDKDGVAAIVGLHKRVKRIGGITKAVGIKDQPRAIFKMLRLDKVLGL
jgi:anti-sigma B factor antagonist